MSETVQTCMIHDLQQFCEEDPKSDPVSLDTAWTTMTAAKEAGHEGQGAKADHDARL